MKVRILVNGKENNNKRIEEALSVVQKRASAMKIDLYEVYSAINRVEDKLGISKKNMVGVIVDVDYFAQHFPNAYRGTPQSTQFTMERTNSGWVITNIERKRCKTPNKGYNITLTDKAKKAIIESKETF